MLRHIFFVVVVATNVLAAYEGSQSTAENVVDNARQSYGGSSVDVRPPGYGGSGGFNAQIRDYNSMLSSYFEQLNQDIANNANSYAYTTSDLNSKAKAESSLSYDQGLNSIKNIHQNIQSQYGFPNGFPNNFAADGAGVGGFGGSFSGPGAGGFPQGAQGSFASASGGPGGSYQTAAVFPENPSMPNIIHKFSEGAGEQGQGGSDGKPHFYGVMSSSVSSSSNIDGEKKVVQKAQTTVNDNGKITTYISESP